jgi:hypothetical protein
MTPATIIREAQADGVSLTLSPAGTIKATGDGAAVNRWLTVIRERKAEIADVLKVGAGDTAAEPFDREAFEERAGIAEFDGGLTREDAERLAWQEDDRRRCGQCLNLRGEVCSIAKPGGLVSANRGYRPVDLPVRCAGYSPKAGDTDQRAGAVRWPGLAS